jgi:hypothetical protein
MKLYRWLTKTVQPWKWRPGYYTDRRVDMWTFGSSFFIDWAPGWHFDKFGVCLEFGNYAVYLYIRDNN